MTLDDLKRLAMSFVASELLEHRPKLVFLDGPMGSGKTTFVTNVAEQLGAADAASPSFAIHSRYEGHRGTVDHFDLDRLHSMDEIASIGFWDILEDVKSDSRRFVMVEWASRLKEFGISPTPSFWQKDFRVWKVELSGPPKWQVQLRRLQA
jgi:tRNA threonylcarbamoyladenosine biosynthesis protein TsaE